MKNLAVNEKYKELVSQNYEADLTTAVGSSLPLENIESTSRERKLLKVELDKYRYSDVFLVLRPALLEQTETRRICRTWEQ